MSDKLAFKGMVMIILKHILAPALIFCIINPAAAMRCGDKLIFEGDSKYIVQTKCGDPLDKQITEEQVPIYDYWGYQIGVTTNTVEKWIYQRSSAEFMYELTFDNGVVKTINANRNP